MAVALPRIPVSKYPISQLFNDMRESLPSYLQSADETFDIAVVNKLSEEGLLRTIRRENLATGREDVLGPRFSYIENKRTGQLYLKEPAYIMAVKCALI